MLFRKYRGGRMKIQVLKDISSANDAIAAKNKQALDKQGVVAINIMSSPGAGKTSLILQTIAKLRSTVKIAVIEGDVASRIDAEKIDKQGIPVVQINVGGSCSLEAHMISSALDKFTLKNINLLFIENVGNLICPAEFDLGEHRKVVIASLPEGDDKPSKYPLIFSQADAIIINKIDLALYVDFNLADFRKVVLGLNPDVAIFEVSCKTGKGMDKWFQWLTRQVKKS
jgi:hydrogenase nickel incorporation protein HypB